jgi:hypothetical protein
MWEYKVITIGTSVLERYLNELGKDGWELFLWRLNTYNDSNTLIFKRFKEVKKNVKHK